MADNITENYLESSVLEFNIGSARVQVLSFGRKETGREFFGRTLAKNHFEIHYIIDGKGVLMANGKEYALKKEMMYVAGPEQLFHHFGKDAGLDEYYMSIHIDNSGSELCKILTSNGFFVCGKAQECLLCFRSAEREIQERKQFYIESAVNNFKQLLIFLTRQYGYNETDETLPHAAKEDKYCLITDEEFIFNLRGLSLKSLSEKLGLSQRQCQRFLMDNYGMSYSEKLLQSRMIKASDYLAFTNKDIQDIVEEVGYSESSYFTRIFKRSFGITPREYRKRCKSTN